MLDFIEYNLTDEEMALVEREQEHFNDLCGRIYTSGTPEADLEAAVVAHDNKYSSEQLEKFMMMATTMQRRDRILAVAERVLHSDDPEKAREAEIASYGGCHTIEELKEYASLGREKLLALFIKQDEEGSAWFKTLVRQCAENGTTMREYLGLNK